MTLQDSCDTLYKSTRKLVFEIEENRCAVTGAAVLGGENKNTDRADAQSVFLTRMVDLPLRGINFDSTYPHKKISPPVKRPSGIFGGGWWIRTTEGVASRFTVCPLWPLGKSPIYEVWSWWTDSNPRPADYKSAALPAELHQRLTSEDHITRLHPVCQQKFSPPAGIFYINRHRHHIHPCTQERGGS